MRTLRLLLLILALCLLSGIPALADVLYTNGPINGGINAASIFNLGSVSGDYSVTNSFSLSSPSTVTGATFGVWIGNNNTLTSVDWAITTLAFDGTTLGSGTVNPGDSFITTNSQGYGIYSEDFSIPSLSLAAGNYWFQLGNAVSTAGAGIQGLTYWDESDGPSTAFQRISSINGITITELNPANHEASGVAGGSEAFDIIGTATVPEPASLLLLGTGLGGLALAVWRRRK